MKCQPRNRKSCILPSIHRTILNCNLKGSNYNKCQFFSWKVPYYCYLASPTELGPFVRLRRNKSHSRRLNGSITERVESVFSALCKKRGLFKCIPFTLNKKVLMNAHQGWWSWGQQRPETRGNSSWRCGGESSWRWLGRLRCCRGSQWRGLWCRRGWWSPESGGHPSAPAPASSPGSPPPLSCCPLSSLGTSRKLSLLNFSINLYLCLNKTAKVSHKCHIKSASLSSITYSTINLAVSRYIDE